MKKYSVTLYYHGCYEVDVEAENEELALVAARAAAEKEDPAEFIRSSNIEEEDHDVSEISSAEQADEWWAGLDFRTMEEITGLKETDYSPEDGSQAFVDACDAWWNSFSDLNKVAIWRSHQE